ncbi:hypothetical protein ACFOW1_01655 [Parasediminibacterium paludis]|uniref:Uncharacterized protein n=1 Tax=Parasediminibacterium paludis TaxID=908966 RepID=A0ABV8PRE6_9BACT
MKKLILLAALIAAVVCVHAQVIDTVPQSIQVQPKVNEITNDTTYQVTWLITDGLGRDTTAKQFYIAFYGRSTNLVYGCNKTVPFYIYKNQGTNNTLIDDYILALFKLIRR